MPFEDWMWAIWLGIMIIMVIVECMGPALVSIWFAAGALVSLVLVRGCECDHINSVKTVIVKVF